ncbi:MAG: AAA family ATPase [Bacteroidota bacterium]
MKIHIFGASGSGVTTLGKALAEKLKVPYFDTDDYYWKKTDPPFTQKEAIPDRQANILKDTAPLNDWILGGSLVSWGEFIKDTFELAIFLYLPAEIRMERLKKREYERYGNIIFDDPIRHQQYLDFIAWASRYDDDTFEGRSKKIHLNWYDTLKSQKIKIVGDLTTVERIEMVLRAVENCDK